MAYDGIVTWTVVRELQETILHGKIEKIYQPQADELVFHIHTKKGNYKLFASTGSSHARVHFIQGTPVNPPAPYAFCMLLRKHLQGGRILDIQQKDSERIIEVSLETMNELGFNVSKKIIFEIMGKHSNIILTDMNSGKIIDSIKRISFDVNRVRQLLPGMIYQYPPSQDKIPFKEIINETPEVPLTQLEQLPSNGKKILSTVGGISPTFAQQLSNLEGLKRREYLKKICEQIQNLSLCRPTVYLDEQNIPVEFYPVPLDDYEDCCQVLTFQTMSQALEHYFGKKESSNQARQKSHELIRTVSAHLDKMYLKKKRLSEDLINAQNSQDYRVFGELLTANIHLVKAGMSQVEVMNYYTNEPIVIPLDVKCSPAKNAQHYFKKYAKSKIAVKEKQIQLTENESEIKYLESVLSFLENTEDVNEIQSIRTELVETGYARARKQVGGFRDKKEKPSPYRYVLSSGMPVLVGRNNKENDYLTFKLAGNKDLWLHTKDIPGSHIIVQTGGQELSEAEIWEAASIAAYHSKARTSENVAVDYVPVKYVKKPAGSKPGMVIFTNQRTVWVNPMLPNNLNSKQE